MTAALAATLSLTSCTYGGRSEDGPLIMGGEDGILCIPSTEGAQVGFGDVAEVAADDSVVLEAARVDDLDGAHLDGLYVVPIIEGQAIMSMSMDAPPAWWGSRESITGTTVAGGEAVNVVAVLTRTGSEEAHGASLSIEYRTGNGRRYVATGTTSVVLADTCA